MVPSLTIHLLGRFRVFRGEQAILESAWTRRKARMLFAFLALRPDRRAHKEQLLDLLWPDFSPAAAANNLHKTLYHLRHTLCPDRAEAKECPYVEFDGETVSLAPHLLGGVDVDEFESRAARAHASDDPAFCTSALEVYADDLLPDDLYEDWTIPRREALRKIALELLRRLGRLHRARREYAEAIAAWQRLLDTEPADEAAHRALIEACALSGQRHQALRQYHRCVEALARELDAGPLPETVAVYQAVLAGELHPEPAIAPSLPLLPAPHRLIGREKELQALLAALDPPSDAGPRLALLHGEAGVGKSRLANEVAWQAARKGWPVMAGVTFEPLGALDTLPLPYGPIVDALRRFLADQPPEVREQLIGPWQAELSRLLPELGSPALVADAESEPDAAKRRLFEAVAHLLGAIAAADPLLLVLDDLHAADQATLELLGYLLFRPPPFRLRVLGSVRDETAAGRRPVPLEELLARLGRRGLLARISLPPLDQSEIRQLVYDRLPGSIDEGLIGTIQQASEGNPLFAEQLLQSWQEEGAIRAEASRWQVHAPDQPLPLPTSLRATIGARLGRLPAGVQEMLALGAVIGREFPYPWMLAGGPWDEPALLDLLDQALQAKVLEEVAQPTGPLLYRFHHGLIRQTLYEGLSEARRRHLHRRLAEVLEDLPDVPFSTLSHHWFATHRWPWAFCHALTAADLALQAFAHTEAVSLYNRCLAAATGEWQPGPDLLARVHASRVQALMGMNRPAEAVADLEWLAGRAARSGDRAAYGQTLNRLATAHFWAHNLEAARQYAQQALDIAQETGDALTAALCTSNLGCVALSIGDVKAGTHYLERVLDQARALGRPALLMEALACLPGGYHWGGDSARSLPLVEEGIVVARREGLGFWLGNLLFFAGLAHGSLGHYEQALDYFRQGQRYSQEAGDLFTAIRVVNCLGWITYELYDTANAIAFDRQGVEAARGFPWPEPLGNALVNLGFDHMLTGEWTEAERAFDQAEALVGQDVWMEWRWHTRLLLGRGELALARAELERAEAFARQALELAEKTGARKNQARAHLLLGEAALAAGDSRRAFTILRRAVDLAQAVSNPRLLWQGLAACARAAQALGDRSGAAEDQSRAGQVIQSIAAGLRDEHLRNTFLNAGPVRAVLNRTGQAHHP